ncbi:Uup ABC transporter ATPase component [Encephalitozoon intestinalis ATCC 50506]|uniref:Uup ABC transporter ATPase component n=1 Tax=Encephalitozoon intestinalis (strain ATCC 50506) TaxID=876142 RepID=E0S6Y5_ENCIT|nr:Uup ABC transporter ATPase component [Encephalitozoon intestinalis ATCC 50506]ADM11571.1 Uup ABC transporter ATPase component [Encephalitozoon intestinalis ATCC 50506]UTX45288.1 ATP-binding cassette sub-family F protein [Encephalitozoon intestinalis]
MDRKISSLKSKYLGKLEKFPFESKEEAIAVGVESYTVDYGRNPIPLETPFSMRSIESRKEEAIPDTIAEEEYLLESSSSGEDTDSEEFEGDLHLNIDLFVRGKEIVRETPLTIIKGRKYGLVGRNGIGKTTLLKAIRKRKFGIPRGMKIYMIRQDLLSEGTVEEFVGAEAGRTLNGLGFTKDMVGKKMNDLSGGWRMRAHLAKAINMNPDLLLLDEPTNYLDINALSWLEKKVKELKTVIIVSHDRNFLNSTTEMILHLNDLKIDMYKGNYENFVRQRKERMTAAKREYENQLTVREHMQTFIDRFRYNAKRASLVQSKIKALAKMPTLVPPKQDPIIKFSFSSTPSQGILLEMSGVGFSYGLGKTLQGLDIRIMSNSRIVVVGANGQGKSTFLKLLAGKIEATEGNLIRSPSLRVGYFAQHHVDQLKINENVLDFMMKSYGQEESRRVLASFGLNVDNQCIGTLSGGQKSRLGFAIINGLRPNLLVLDEPTNHLDMESIDALAEALRRFEGAVVCVSHDLSFIDSVFKEIYVCENRNIKRFYGSILEYKKGLNI